MITKNYKIFASTSLSRTTAQNESVDLPFQIKDISGTEYSTFYFSTSLATYLDFMPDSSNSPNLAGSQYNNSIQLYVGTNDTEVTENDYTLGDIETLSSVGYTTATRSIDGEGFAMTITRTLQNTSDSEITIKEMGLVRSTLYKKDNYVKLLFAREVLPTPLVVPSGNSFTVSMVVKI